MQNSTLISEMQKFQFGSRILCSDGEDGVLTHVGFDPATRRVTHIGVKPGHLFSKTVYLPYETVEGANGDGVTLNITRDQLSAADKSEPGGSLFASNRAPPGSDLSAALSWARVMFRVTPSPFAPSTVSYGR